MPLPVAPRVVEAPPPVSNNSGRIPVPALNRRDYQQISYLAPVGQERDFAPAGAQSIDGCAFAHTRHPDEDQHGHIDDCDPAGGRTANAETVCQQFKFSTHPHLAFWKHPWPATAVNVAVAHAATLYAAGRATGNKKLQWTVANGRSRAHNPAAGVSAVCYNYDKDTVKGFSNCSTCSCPLMV